MIESVANLAVAIGPLGLDTRAGLKLLRTRGFGFAQLSATSPDVRPRELDQSARRDLGAALGRLELQCSGLDLFIPSRHFTDPAQADRAVAAVGEAIELAADLGRISVSLVLPADLEPAMLAGLSQAAEHFGVRLANHAVPEEGGEGPGGIGVGVDPAACLASGVDPAHMVLVARSSVVTARLSDLSSEGLRVPPGREGRLDLPAYAAALAVVEYSRPVVIDPRQWADPRAGIESARSAWQKIMPNVG